MSDDSGRNDTENLNDQVITVLSQALMIKREKISASSRLFRDLGAESIDMLDIRFRLEKRFGFKIAEKDFVRMIGDDASKEMIEDLLTVQRIIDYVHVRRAGHE